MKVKSRWDELGVKLKWIGIKMNKKKIIDTEMKVKWKKDDQVNQTDESEITLEW